MNNPEFKQVIDAINRAVTVMDEGLAMKGGGSSGNDAFKKDLEEKNQEKLSDILPKLEKHLDHNIPTKDYFDTAFKNLSDNFTKAIEANLKEQKRANELAEMRKIKKTVMPVSVMEFDKKALKQLAGLLKGVGLGRGGLGMGMMAGAGGAAGAGGGSNWWKYILGGLGATALARRLLSRKKYKSGRAQDPKTAKKIRDLQTRLNDAEIERTKLEGEARKAKSDLEAEKQKTKSANRNKVEADKRVATKTADLEKAQTKVKNANKRVLALTEQAALAETRRAELETANDKKFNDLNTNNLKERAINEQKIKNLRDEIQSNKNLTKSEIAAKDAEIKKLEVENGRLIDANQATIEQNTKTMDQLNNQKKLDEAKFQKDLKKANDDGYRKGLVEDRAKQDAAKAETERVKQEKIAAEKKAQLTKTQKNVTTLEESLNAAKKTETKLASQIDNLNAPVKPGFMKRAGHTLGAPLRAARAVPGVKAVGGAARPFLGPLGFVLAGGGTFNRQSQTESDLLSEDGSFVQDILAMSYEGWKEVFTDPGRVDPYTLRPAWEDKVYDILTSSNQVGSMWNEYDFSKNWVPGDMGSRADKVSGVLGAAGFGAAVGAGIGSFIPIPFVGTGVGAAVGGTLGAAAEIYKIYSDPVMQQRKHFAGLAYKEESRFFEELYGEDTGILRMHKDEVEAFTAAMKDYDKAEGHHEIRDRTQKNSDALQKLFTNRKLTDAEVLSKWKSGEGLGLGSNQGAYQNDMKAYWEMYGGYNSESGWDDAQILDTIKWLRDEDNKEFADMHGEFDSDKQKKAIHSRAVTASAATFNKRRHGAGSKEMYNQIKDKSEVELFKVKLKLSNGQIDHIPPEYYRMFRHLWLNMDEMSKGQGQAHYGHIKALFGLLNLPGALQKSEMDYLRHVDERVNSDELTQQQGNIEKILHGQDKHGLTLDQIIQSDGYDILDSEGKVAHSVGGLQSDAWLLKNLQENKAFGKNLQKNPGSPAAWAVTAPGGQGFYNKDTDKWEGNSSGWLQEGDELVGRFYDADAQFFAGFMKALPHDPAYNAVMAKMASSGKTDNMPVWGTGMYEDRSLAEFRVPASSPMATYVIKRWTEAGDKATFGENAMSGKEGLTAFRVANSQIKTMLKGSAWEWKDGETKMGWDQRLSTMGLGHKQGQMSWEMMPHTASGYRLLQKSGLFQNDDQIRRAFGITYDTPLGTKTAQEIMGTAATNLQDTGFLGTGGNFISIDQWRDNNRIATLNAPKTTFHSSDPTGLWSRGKRETRPSAHWKGSQWDNYESANRRNAGAVVYYMDENGQMRTMNKPGAVTPGKRSLFNMPGTLNQSLLTDPNSLAEKEKLLNARRLTLDPRGKTGPDGKYYAPVGLVADTASAGRTAVNAIDAMQADAFEGETIPAAVQDRFLWLTFAPDKHPDFAPQRFRSTSEHPNRNLNVEIPPVGHFDQVGNIPIKVELSADQLRVLKQDPPIIHVPPTQPTDENALQKSRDNAIQRIAPKE